MQLDALAFGAHPDDVELTCAGTLIKLANRGYRTGVCALTQGEMGTRGNAETRRQEFEAAAKIMGLATHRLLDLPDGNVQVTWENKLKVIRVLRELKPTIVFLPYWFDRHPDHGHASELVQEAAFVAGLKRIETGQEPHRPRRLLYYPCRYEFIPSFIVDISDTHERKMEAIRAYQSQFYNPELDEAGLEQTFISTPEFLEFIITRAKQYGSYIGAKYAEPFLVREPIRIDDPVALFAQEGPTAIL